MTIIYLKSISSDTVGLPCLFFFFNPCFWKRFFYLFLMWWIFLAAWSFSLVVVSGGCSHCSTKASHCRVWALGAWASAVVAHGFTSCSSWTLEHSCGTHGLSSSAACGVFPDQGSNLCLLLWQMDSLPLSHQKPNTQFYSFCDVRILGELVGWFYCRISHEVVCKLLAKAAVI